MGSAVRKNGSFVSFLGVKGGVGCSTLCSLLGRVASKKNARKVAIIDGAPGHYSLLPSYLGVTPSNHCLTQIQPYQEHLTSKIIESFFPLSPEGVAYVPIRQKDDIQSTPQQTLLLLQALSRWFDDVFLDLSSFPNDQVLFFLEKSHRVFLVSSPEPAALNAMKNWEKRLLPLHYQLQRIDLIFNQSHSRPVPKDAPTWSRNFTYAGTLPSLGEDLSLHLIENRALTASQEKLLEALAQKITLDSKYDLSLETLNAPISNSQSEYSLSDPHTLEQVQHLHQKLLEQLRKSGVLENKKIGNLLHRQALEPTAREILDQLIQEMEIPNRESRQQLVAETLNLAFGLGPLEPLLQNEEVTEIMVNGPSHIFAEKRGLIEKTKVHFFDDQQLRTVIERILAPIGRRIDEGQPYVDGRLPDGSRVNAVIPPLSLSGPLLTIRKFPKRKLGVEDLIQSGSLTKESSDFLGACVRGRKNIVVSGGTGSGKTTLLNILSNFIPANERIITIEDSAELRLSQEHVVRLECRPPNLEGKGQITIRDLVINALRMRPDRIVVGEVRGGEALDMLQAMNTGHDGSITTAHANSTRDALSRLETMALLSGLDLPLKAIREQIARAVHLIIQQSRLRGGKRAVTQIAEVQGMEGDVIVTQELFSFDDEKGLVRQPFAPSFVEELTSFGYEWPGHQLKTKA